MQHRLHPVTSAAVRALCVLLTALAVAGCNSVDHVRAFRDIRESFSMAAQEDNKETLERLKANGPTATDPVGSPNHLLESYDRWEKVHQDLVALNKSSADDLKSDGLYYSSKTLELLAANQRQLFGHLLETVGDLKLDGNKPLTDTLAAAEALMKEAGGTLYPRDRYSLSTLKAQVRFQIAYLNAARSMAKKEITRTVVQRTGEPQEKFEERRKAMSKRVNDLVMEIAKAEGELAAFDLTANPHVAPHAVMSRMIMLSTGRKLIENFSGYAIIDVKGMYGTSRDAYPGVKALDAQMERFHKAATTVGSVENRFLVALGTDPIAQPDLLKNYEFRPSVCP